MNFIRPFDLSHPPLHRVGLLKEQEDKYILVVDMHHIITDGISHDILAREFTALYAGEELPFLRLQYKDYAEWENSDTRKEARKKQETYWLKEFTGEIPLLHLPMDHARPETNKTFREYLMEVKEKALNAYENQDYPFEELVDRLGIPRQPGRQPLVDAVFAFYEENQLGPQESQARQAAAGASHFDLMIYITARNDAMSAIFEFSTDLFNKSTIEEFSNSYQEILVQVVENPDITLKEIKITFPHHLMAARSAFIRDDKDAWEL
jgi:hypothetical protein